MDGVVDRRLLLWALSEHRYDRYKIHRRLDVWYAPESACRCGSTQCEYINCDSPLSFQKPQFGSHFLHQASQTFHRSVQQVVQPPILWSQRCGYLPYIHHGGGCSFSSIISLLVPLIIQRVSLVASWKTFVSPWDLVNIVCNIEGIGEGSLFTQALHLIATGGCWVQTVA